MNCKHPDSKRYIVGEKKVAKTPAYKGAPVTYETINVEWCRSCGSLMGFKPKDKPAEGSWQPPDRAMLVSSDAKPNPHEDRYRWTIEIEVAEIWVEDGFDLANDEHAKSLIAERLSWANGHELGARVLSRPDDAAIAKAQGHKTVDEYLKARTK